MTLGRNLNDEEDVRGSQDSTVVSKVSGTYSTYNFFQLFKQA